MDIFVGSGESSSFDSGSLILGSGEASHGLSSGAVGLKTGFAKEHSGSLSVITGDSAGTSVGTLELRAGKSLTTGSTGGSVDLLGGAGQAKGGRVAIEVSFSFSDKCKFAQVLRIALTTFKS